MEKKKVEGNRRMREAGIDSVCSTNIRVGESCTSVTSHYIVAYEACHNDWVAASFVQKMEKYSCFPDEKRKAKIC